VRVREVDSIVHRSTVVAAALKRSRCSLENDVGFRRSAAVNEPCAPATIEAA
jgi:hypothetical protein